MLKSEPSLRFILHDTSRGPHFFFFFQTVPRTAYTQSRSMCQSKSAEELSRTEAACKNTNVEFRAVRTNRN